MGYMDEYNKLKKKRLEEEAKSSGKATTSVGSSYLNQYNRLRGQSNGAPTLDSFIRQRISLGKKDEDEEKEKEKEAESKKEERKWFQKGAFEDGYQFGDVTKTIFGSTEDAETNIWSGILGIGEKLVDTGMMLGTAMNQGSMMQAAQTEMIYNTISGNKEAASTTLQRYQNAQDEVEKATGEFVAKDLYDEKKIAQTLISGKNYLKQQVIGYDAETDSVFGDKSDSLMQSGGQLVAQIGANTFLPGSGMALMAATAFGSEAENAFKNGATFDEAMLSATISAGAEVLTERLGGISFGGKTLTDKAFEPLARKMTSKLTKALVYGGKIAADATAEGLEEVVSGYASAIGQQMTYMEDKEIEELFSNEDKLEAFIGGFVLGGVGGAVEVAHTKSKGVDPISGLTKNEQAVANKVYEDELAKKEESGKVSSREKTKLFNKIVKDMEQGRIDTDTIESVLGGESYEGYKSLTEQETSVKEEIEALENTPENQFTVKQRERLTELREQLKGIDTKTAKSNLFSEVDKLTANDTKLRESYNEKTRRGQAFEADLTQYDAKQQETIKKAVESGILNNTNRTHEFVDLVAKISADKGVPFDFTNNQKLKESGFAIDGKQVSSYVTKDGVTVNVNSAKSLDAVVGQEITKVLEGTDLSTELQAAVIEYAKSKNDYQGRYDALTKLYENVEGANIDSALTAELVGEYLRTDTDFINKLSTNHRNVFQKVYDEVKYMLKVATAGSKEARELKQLGDAFSEAAKIKTDADIMTREEYDQWRVDELNRLNPQLKGVLKAEFVDGDSYAINSTDGVDGMKASGSHTGSIVKRAKDAKVGTFTHEILHTVDMLTNYSVRHYVEDMKSSGHSLDDYDALVNYLKDARNQGKIGGRATDSIETAQMVLHAYYADRDGLRSVAPNLVEQLEGLGIDKYSHLIQNYDQYTAQFNNGDTVEHSVSERPEQANSDTAPIISVLTGKEISPKTYEILDRLGRGEAVTLEELDSLPEVVEGKERVKEDTAKFLAEHSGFKDVPTKELGTYLIDSAERDQLRNSVLKERLESGSFTHIDSDGKEVYNGSVEKGKRLDIVIGLPAAGKSSAVVLPLSQHYKSVVVDSDIIKEKLPEFNGGWGTALVHEESKILNSRLFVDELALGNNIVLPVVGDKTGSLENYIGLAKRQGYDVYLHLNELNSSKAMGRNLGRYFSEGRFIPPEVAWEKGDKPTAVYEEVKNRGDISGYSHWNNDVQRGQRPTLTDVSGNLRTYAEYSNSWRASRGTDIERSDGEVGQGTFADSGNRVCRLQGRLATDATTGRSSVQSPVLSEVVRLTPKTEEALNKSGVVSLELIDSSGDSNAFSVALDSARKSDADHGWAVTPKSAEELVENNIRTIMTPDGGAGLGVAPDGDIEAVFKNQNSGLARVLDTLMPAALEMGGNKLDCYGEDLVRVYAKYGFVPVARVTFNPEYANDGWTPDKGTPDIFFMAHNGDSADTVASNIGKYKKWTTEELNALPLFGEDYDGAYAYRDSKLPQAEFAPVRNDAESVLSSKDYAPGESLEEQLAKADETLESLDSEVETLFRDYSDQNISDAEFQARWKDLDKRFTQARQEQERLSAEMTDINNRKYESLDDSDIPPEVEAPYYDEAESIAPADPFAERDMVDVGNRKVKAYMYENPDVKPFFQDAARGMLYDLHNGTKGERIFNEQVHYESGYEKGWMGTSRRTTGDIAELLDQWGYSYAQIEAGLNAIIEDNGKENNAASKRIEFMLDKRLRNGYKDVDGRPIPRDDGYINLLKEKAIDEHRKEGFDSFMENADKYAPPAEDIAPVENVVPAEDIAPLKVEPATESEQTVLDEFEQTDQAQTEQAPERLTRAKLHSQIVDRIKSVFTGKGIDFDKVLDNAHRMNALSINDNTPQRVNDKTFGYEAGEALNELTFNKVALDESNGVKWENEQVGMLRKLSKKYKIKPRTKEAAAVQMYAEGFWVNEQDEIIAYGDAELAKDFPDDQVQKRIKALANDPTIRKIYDDTLSAINESRRRNAYPEIPRLENYFLHYRAQTDTFSRLGVPFNPNDIKAKDLPTDINGTTIDRKPGQPFFTSAMHREGKRTSFDVFDGLERYIHSAKNQIYHIDNIQTARALWGYIADRYGQAHGLENLDDMEFDAQQEHIQKVYDGHLSNYARFLVEYANNLAGKTALIDRGVEGLFGRRALQFINTVNMQASRNQVGYSISSPLTNIIPSMEAIARTPKQDSIKAFAQTVSNVFRKDGFVESDPTLIRRKGADRFSKTLWEKMSDPGFILMGAVDNVTSEFIVRTKYNELTRKGMDSKQAHIKAGEWASRVMGDRSLGQMPLVYNSKFMGLFTKYQLEVRNALDSQFYDTFQEAKASTKDIENQKAKNAATAAKFAYKAAQIAVLNHVFGMAFEKIAGYNPAFDIVSTIATLFGWDDDEDDEDTFGDNAEQAFKELLGDLPYTSLITDGGRIPAGSALPIKQFVTGIDKYGNEKSRWETLAEAAPYYLLPGGYSQIKKTTQGLGMFSEEHPVYGSYTDSGNLRFPVEKTFGNVLQAGLFGQYASENARDYFDNERSPLKEKQIQEYLDVDIPIKDYWEYREGLKGKDTLGEKLAYIDTLDLPISKKNILANNQADRDEPIDMAEWGKYGDLEEFDYAVKYPEKYKFLEANGITVEEYNNFDDDTKDAYSWAYQNPEKYAVSKAISDDVVEYKSYTKAIGKIEADKDENGKSINGSRKEKVYAYIDSLPIDYGQKSILFKSQYKSDDSMNMDIIEYLDSREDIDYDEMVTILTELDFTVNGNNVYWD